MVASIPLIYYMNPDISIPGAMLGVGTSSAIGGKLGRYIGGKMVNNPDELADINKISTRYGHLVNPATSNLGAMSDIAFTPKVTNIGVGAYDALSDEGAAKLGYGPIGRLGSYISPGITSLFKPSSLKK